MIYIYNAKFVDGLIAQECLNGVSEQDLPEAYRLS